MTTRRGVIAAGLFAGAAATASGGSLTLLARRQTMPSQHGEDLEHLPDHVGAWRIEPRQEDLIDPVVTDEAFAEALKIYDITVERNYARPGGEAIMLSGVYMRKLAQEQRFHWPELCYQTQGFHVRRLGTASVQVDRGTIPATRFLANREQRRELVMYLTRIGDGVPAGSFDVRMAIFRNSFSAFYPDGVLLRASTIIEDGSEALDHAAALLPGFLSALIESSSRELRALLVGSGRTFPG